MPVPKPDPVFTVQFERTKERGNLSGFSPKACEIPPGGNGTGAGRSHSGESFQFIQFDFDAFRGMLFMSGCHGLHGDWKSREHCGKDRLDLNERSVYLDEWLEYPD